MPNSAFAPSAGIGIASRGVAALDPREATCHLSPQPVLAARSRIREPHDRPAASESVSAKEGAAMAKFLLVYHGGGMPESQEEQAKVMAA